MFKYCALCMDCQLWNINIYQFNDILFRKLFSMEIPNEVTSCRDIHCENEEHKKQIDSFITDLLENVSDTGYETLPVSQPVKENTKNV